MQKSKVAVSISVSSLFSFLLFVGLTAENSNFPAKNATEESSVYIGSFAERSPYFRKFFPLWIIDFLFLNFKFSTDFTDSSVSPKKKIPPVFFLFHPRFHFPGNPELQVLYNINTIRDFC